MGFSELRVVSLIYPFEVLIGWALSKIIGDLKLESQRNNFYILRSSNIVNELFAYHGNQVWLVLFIFLCLVQIYYRSKRFSLLISSESFNGRDQLIARGKPLVKQYICKLILKNLMLILVFSVIDNVFIFSGGECTSGSGTRSSQRCRHENGHWEGGFDISGHFCFLVTISMILWIELHQFKKHVDLEGLSGQLSLYSKIILMTVFTVLCIWVFILFITSVYYHTFMEKVLGCAMGYITPYVMYHIIPNNEFLYSILYH
ncbi:hypothetical protein Kpol_339p11 [Vanderwaltozyma polyspora DSM 70294]|uniref:Acyl-coenzyme A diphosphatase YFT2 n=1 Tax=Vanderwaltozyma polyspora (strain ATCC 22028 / DSM 70294 / BCRC 21397 / CBS 2163 / NBRC 10782 / NRRL Y-8283 / UCD 57-17) TaxID=436907 RepID=A7TSD9_VANPO|nr:uncharacterized protein Kpol_339p11 [Vanderwaltozyma polyspora DSM 70294]EDO14824.1 hypothetical protein Kpol_339p11 [Vanderwaltozyma polyspora DSM 70294]